MQFEYEVDLPISRGWNKVNKQKHHWLDDKKHDEDQAYGGDGVYVRGWRICWRSWQRWQHLIQIVRHHCNLTTSLSSPHCIIGIAGNHPYPHHIIFTIALLIFTITSVGLQGTTANLTTSTSSPSSSSASPRWDCEEPRPTSPPGGLCLRPTSPPGNNQDHGSYHGSGMVLGKP